MTKLERIRWHYLRARFVYERLSSRMYPHIIYEELMRLRDLYIIFGGQSNRLPYAPPPRADGSVPYVPPLITRDK